MSYDISDLFNRYPELQLQQDNILKACSIFKETFKNDGTLFVCGNGGSASDAEHIAGELLKGFLKLRPIDKELRNKLETDYQEQGKFIADGLQNGLKTISLIGHPSLSTAFANDVNASLIFAQQLHVLGKKGDALLALSTSGNSDNVIKCMQLANVKGIKTVAMTGSGGGKCKELAECCIQAPSKETYIVQEYHLPVYHAICAVLEDEFYGE